jgi:hypothetical protein
LAAAIECGRDSTVGGDTTIDRALVFRFSRPQ